MDNVQYGYDRVKTMATFQICSLLSMFLNFFLCHQICKRISITVRLRDQKGKKWQRLPMLTSVQRLSCMRLKMWTFVFSAVAVINQLIN